MMEPDSNFGFTKTLFSTFADNGRLDNSHLDPQWHFDGIDKALLDALYAFSSLEKLRSALTTITIGIPGFGKRILTMFNMAWRVDLCLGQHQRRAIASTGHFKGLQSNIPPSRRPRRVSMTLSSKTSRTKYSTTDLTSLAAHFLTHSRASSVSMVLTPLSLKQFQHELTQCMV